jgi:nucleoside-diphosphate-sugar epimerase
MNVLIIGGTGVLSSAVTAEALRKGLAVTMINRGKRRIPDGVELIKSDKDDLQTIAKALEGRTFDAVMDYLCYTDAQTEKSARFYMKYTKQYFYISSCAVYDTASLNGQMADEDSKKVLPIWKYSVDKWASEEKIHAIFKGSGVNYTIIRPCVTYGDTRIPYGISPIYGYHWTLCARILAGKPIITWNEGKNRCNMTRVEDFAVGVVGLIGNTKAYGEAFNVCGDETPTFREVLDVLSEYLHKEVVTVDVSSEFYAKELPNRAGEILGGRSIDTINSNAKLKALVPEFKQTYSLKEGIYKTLDAYKAQGYQHGIDWKFDAETDRIIKSWIKSNKQKSSNFRIGFVDYQSTAGFKNRIAYWLFFHKNNPIVHVLFSCAKKNRRLF